LGQSHGASYEIGVGAGRYNRGAGVNECEFGCGNGNHV